MQSFCPRIPADENPAFARFDAAEASFLAATAADCRAGARKGPHKGSRTKGSGTGKGGPQRAWKVMRVPGPSPLLAGGAAHKIATHPRVQRKHYGL